MKYIYEKIISLVVLGIIALGVIFGAITIYELRSLSTAKDNVIALKNSDVEAVETLQYYAERKSNNALHYLITSQPKPYLEDMNAARNDFLRVLRDLREKLPASESKTYLDAIEQTEMEHQIYLQKAIDSRRTGPNYIAITITLQNFVEARRVALEKQLRSFLTYKIQQSSGQSAAAMKAAESKGRQATALISTSAVIALGVAGAGWLLVMQLLAGRRRREEKALRSEAQLRYALDATNLITWERDLATDTIEKVMAHLKLYGFSKEPPIWNFETFLRTIHPDDRIRVKQTILNSLAEGPGYEMMFRVKWPDLSVHRIMSKACIVRDESGKAVKIAGFDTHIDRMDALAAAAEVEVRAD
ncbi:MAG: PAS domain-containing protein [Bdellovibrionales bacterium]|nr:PAS domain-containing protein [Bdellovibrionales bacterium]